MFVHKSVGRKTIVGAVVAAALLALSACGKTETGISTAERVKLVEEKQKADSNTRLSDKSADAIKTAQTSAAPTSTQAAPAKTSAALR